MKYKNKIHQKKLLIFIILGIALAICSVFLVLEQKNITNFVGNSGTNSRDANALTTSSQPSAQTDFNEGDDREAGSSLREDEGLASITDTSGENSEDVDKSQPTISASGEITLYSPLKNALVENNIKIAGRTTLPSVSYRLVDSISGVLTRGEFSVVNGQFSGILNIDTNAKEGRLDIFGQQDDGNEYGNVAIPLRFR